MGSVDALKLYAVGFSSSERRLLEGIVRVSQRRTPKLTLLTEQQAPYADVLLIDYKDVNAVAWAKSQLFLQKKAVIWVDANRADKHHLVISRPVQWSTLPIIVSRALDTKTAADESAAMSVANLGHNVNSNQANQIKPSHTTNKRILVVDDSLGVRNHLTSLLEAKGFEVTTAENGVVALQAFRPNYYSCVLLDVIMPEMDGYETCRAIKALEKGKHSTHIVMLTSKSSPFDRIRGKMAGCDAYLTKPVTFRQLQETLSHYVAIDQAISA